MVVDGYGWSSVVGKRPGIQDGRRCRRDGSGARTGRPNYKIGDSAPGKAQWSGPAAVSDEFWDDFNRIREQAQG